MEGKGVTISSRTKWEGSSLLANSIVSGPKNYTRMDRWTLSRDGNTLRVRRQIVSRYGETESLLFYERQSPATHSEAGAVSPRVETGTPSDAMRFGRHVLKPVDPAAYQYTTLDGIAIPSVRNPQVSVSCLAYEEEARIYVEVVLRNDSVRSIDIGDNFIFIESEGRLIPRIDAALVSEKVHAGAVRRFQPTATGKHPRRGEPVYDRAAVDAQVKRPLQWREQESAFAGLLAALAHTGPMTVGPGQESTILATFEQRRDRKSPVIVKIQVGADASRFELKSTL